MGREALENEIEVERVIKKKKAPSGEDKKIWTVLKSK